jgi:hypothetical protein
MNTNTSVEGASSGSGGRAGGPSSGAATSSSPLAHQSFGGPRLGRSATDCMSRPAARTSEDASEDEIVKAYKQVLAIKRIERIQSPSGFTCALLTVGNILSAGDTHTHIKNLLDMCAVQKYARMDMHEAHFMKRFRDNALQVQREPSSRVPSSPMIKIDPGDVHSESASPVKKHPLASVTYAQSGSPPALFSQRRSECAT